MFMKVSWILGLMTSVQSSMVFLFFMGLLMLWSYYGLLVIFFKKSMFVSNKCIR